MKLEKLIKRRIGQIRTRLPEMKRGDRLKALNTIFYVRNGGKRFQVVMEDLDRYAKGDLK